MSLTRSASPRDNDFNMTDDRPNPDELLERVKAEEAEAHRGRLKIFFGYAAGVGKTYAMLEAAHREKAQGVEVVAGYVEPHGRLETESMLEGLEALPFRQVPYRGVMLREFDLDAALARKPQLLLVDELAHTNAEGSRHAKRWQDIEELLEAGIGVYTTLNVQHVESLNDVIAQITGVIVRETLPDAVLEKADEIELIDITPEELIERLQAGKIYLPEQAVRAIQSFFHKANLTALRELSLRQAANRLRRDVDAAHQETAAVEPWATNERLLVCVGASPTTAKLLRSAKRMAAAFGCEWLSVAVETNAARVPEIVRRQVAKHLQFAEQLGAETHTLIGLNVADTVLEYARSRNVTKIVVGKTAQPWWRRIFLGTVVDGLLERSGDIDVYVIRGEAEEHAKVTSPLPKRQQHFDGKPYLWTALVVAVCGSLGWLSQLIGAGEANIVMIFLLGVVLVATWFGRGPAIAVSIANVLVFDFCFVQPYFSFTVNDAKYAWTFAVMLGIGLLHSTIATRVREQLTASQQQERRTDALFRLTRLLSEVMGSEFLIRTAGRQISELFASEVVVFLRQPDDQIELRFGEDTRIAAQPINAIVAQWVATHSQIAGEGTDTLPNATAFFVPLIGSQRTVGTIGVKPNAPDRFLDTEQRRLLETCASMVALAIERDQSVLDAQQAQVQVETEQLRNSLLSSVSHDLRTPLAAMAGAATSLINPDAQLSESTRRELLQSVVDESQRLSRLVENLLDMTRLESGAIRVNREWHVLEEIVGSALHHVRDQLMRHSVTTRLAELPLVHVDGVLFEQVFVNLLENAARYTPAGSHIEITARELPGSIEIHVADNGPGLSPGSESRLFNKFVRGDTAAPDGRRGVGLGLAICRGIVQAHAGSITARNRSEGGAEFVITLPCRQRPPEVRMET
ncbi:MAG: two-component system OmpR family sensor histidine kinase KdpD [Planctomycetota bacterium]|nr:MAG: two-component system OmpR family sensor histidine kinase KdpD [Planctomycetota bacterium]